MRKLGLGGLRPLLLCVLGTLCMGFREEGFLHALKGEFLKSSFHFHANLTHFAILAKFVPVDFAVLWKVSK